MIMPSRSGTPAQRRQIQPGKPEPGRSPAEREKLARADILKVATEEFAAYGLAGARVHAIAKRTRTTKGMIYYYFGSKEQLYIAVIEQIYLSIRSAEENARTERHRCLAVRTVLNLVRNAEQK
jgi:AcrR family transcriptional regulator